MAVVKVRCVAPRQTTEQNAGEASAAKKSNAGGNSFKELSKAPGVLEEGIISFHHREPDRYSRSHPLCQTYILMLPASCRHPVRLLGSECRDLPTRYGSEEEFLGSVIETASMVDDVVTELGPIQPRGRERLYKPIPATSIVGKGVYVLYYDGSDVRLLTRLCEHDRSAYAEGGRAAFGVYKTGDNVIIVGHDLQALWNRNTLQRMGVSSYSSKPVPHPALLNRKGFKFMLCGHHIFYGRHGDSPSNIPQSLTQLLDKAAKEDPSPKNLRNDIHNATTQIDKLPMQLAVDLSILETPENGTTKNWPTYRIRLHTGRFTIRNCILKLQLLLFKTCIPEATISPMEEEAYTKGVTCLVSCPMEDAERYCEALRRKGLSSTIELA